MSDAEIGKQIPVRITARQRNEAYFINNLNFKMRSQEPNNCIRININNNNIQPNNVSSPNPITRSSHYVPTLLLANVMSLAPKIDEVRLFLQQNSVDICCLTETWLKNTIDDTVIHIHDYNLERKDRVLAQHGGVALYIKDSIKVERLREYEINDGIEVLWCKLRPHRLPRGFSSLIVGVLYHPPASNDNEMIEYLMNTLSNIESAYLNAALLLAGDFNRLDVAPVTNQFRLKQMIKIATRGERTLDLVLTNLHEYYQDPVKFPPFGLSDHCTIIIHPKYRTIIKKKF